MLRGCEVLKNAVLVTAGVLLVAGCERGGAADRRPSVASTDATTAQATSRSSVVNPPAFQASASPTSTGQALPTSAPTSAAGRNAPGTGSIRSSPEQTPSPAAVAAPSPALQPGDERIAQVERELLEAWEGVCSVTAKVETKFVRGKNYKTNQSGNGTIQYVKENGKVLMKFESMNDIFFLRPDGKNWIITAQAISSLCDGDYLYKIDRRREGTTATKSWCEPPEMRVLGGEKLMRRIRLLKDRRLLKEETMDGRAVYGFEGKTADGDTKIRHYVEKATGVLIKTEFDRERDDSTFSFSLREIELDREYPPDHFTFVPPEFVPIEDLTRHPRKGDPSESDAGAEAP